MEIFGELGVSPKMYRAVEGVGYENPTPVQEEMIPCLLGENNDVVALAQTGTGKTAAFGLPLIQKVNVENRIPQSSVLYPTHELCLQIAGDLDNYSEYTDGLKILPVCGGSSIDSQIRNLERGVHTIVATPGRLLDLMERKAVSLATVTNVVVDEADEMLNMGFTEGINAIPTDAPQEHNTLLFSATMSPEIARTSKNYLHDAKEVTIGHKNESTSNVKHVVYTVHTKDKYAALKRIVDYYPQIYDIAFCRTRKEAQGITDKLMREDYSTDSLHGELSQTQRDTVTQKFRIRSLQILVATDIVIRGLDVDDLTHVINHRLPDDTGSYTHRSGYIERTSKAGTSVAIINLREKGKIHEIECVIGEKFTAGEMPIGKQICEKQLLKMIGDLEEVKVDEEDIDDFIPEIYRKLEWLSKEDLAKRMVLHEFNRFMDYYRNHEGMEVSTDSRSERVVESRDGKSGRQAEPGFTRLFINLGKMDNFFPHKLTILLSDNTHGRVELERIDLMKNFSFFEVEEKQAQNVVKALNRTNWNGREVIVEVAGGKVPTERRRRRKRDKGSNRDGKGRNTAASIDHKDKGGASKDGKQTDTRKARKPSREEHGYFTVRGPEGEDEWKQFFKDVEPDFSEKGWARRKPKKN